MPWSTSTKRCATLSTRGACMPIYDGDHLHPGDAGLVRMGDVVDLAPFD
jgi:hypothetical protein